MFPRSRQRQAFLAGGALLVALLVGTTAAAVPTADNPAQLLEKADSIKSSNNTEFVTLMQQLSASAQKLAPEQRLHLKFLKGWQIAYRGDYTAAIALLDEVIGQSTNATLRFRAEATVVNMLGIGSRYVEAYTRLNQMLDQLPQVTDKGARTQGLGVASILYSQAGQYDLATIYADQVIKESSDAESACRGSYLNLQALYKSDKMQTIDRRFQDGIDACVKTNEPIFANLIRDYVAGFEIKHERSAAAIELLQKNYVDVQRTHYPPLIADFDASLARAYWEEGELGLSQQFAMSTLSNNIKSEYTESLTTAYELLYLIAQKQGDTGAALAYHEKYMAADKGYLNDVSAKALAYQTVKQQVSAKKLQIDALSKQNQILKLQQSLSTKAAEASRLSMLLLLVVLASIAFWAYKIKRSQLRFMKLARRDGLTGIFNRQHFVSEAELQLQYCRKSSRVASLVLIDLDHFKAVNDNHGHAVGDRVLKRAVEACESHLRSTDVFGRLGGEEFGILLPECTQEQAVARAEQIRRAIALASTDEGAIGFSISASFGIASTSYFGYELRQLLIHADEALYQAKREGRNRVNVCSSTQENLHVA